MKINRNFAKIALLFLFFPTGFNEWNMSLFATDQVAPVFISGETAPKAPVSRRETEKPASFGQKSALSQPETRSDASPGMPDLSQGKEDGLPLYFPGEQEDLLNLATWLKNTQDRELEKLSFGPVSFITLSEKSKALRSKVVQVSGRLLKTRFLPIMNTEGNGAKSDAESISQKNDAGEVIKGFYESWVLLDDNPKIPVRLWSLSIPSENLLREPDKNNEKELYRRERITATGMYYRMTSFYDGTDFRCSPMLLAKNFIVLENQQPGGTATDSRANNRTESQTFPGIKIICVVFIVLVWLVYRVRWRRKYKNKRFDNNTAISFVLLSSLGFSLGSANVFGQSEKTSHVDTHPQTRHVVSSSIPQTGSDATPHQADQRSTGLPSDTANMLRAIARVQRKSVFWDALPPERRSAFLRKRPLYPDMDEKKELRYPFWGKIVEVKKILIPKTSDASKEERFYYRCLVSTSDTAGSRKTIIVNTSFLPSFQINRLGKLADISQEQDKTSRETPLRTGIGETVGGIGFLMADESRREKQPVLCAAHFGWYPESIPLGKLGMDVASFDSVPVYAPQYISRLTRKDDSGIPPEERRQVMSSLRLTKADTDAFYGLLLAGSRVGSPQLFQEAKSYLTKTENSNTHWPAVELFNRPQYWQGELVLLRGHARRVERIPVQDDEIRKRFGIDSYYQIVFFTPDSQGNPLIVCVRQLPDGMPVGSGPGYREEIEVAAFFFKSWAYRGSMPRERQDGRSSGRDNVSEPLDTAGEIAVTDGTNAESSTDRSSDTVTATSTRRVPWVKAPLLVGGAVRWTPQPSGPGSVTPESVRWTFIIFSALAFVFFSYRLFRRRFVRYDVQ